MNTIDLFTGFEGELGAYLREKASSGEVVSEVHLWHGYFSLIIGLIPFNSFSDIDSVVYNYNVNPNWGVEDSEYLRLQEFKNQLISLNIYITNDYQDAYNAIKQICQSAMQNGNKLYYKG